jgi:hypothetical protein
MTKKMSVRAIFAGISFLEMFFLEKSTLHQIPTPSPPPGHLAS